MRYYRLKYPAVYEAIEMSSYTINVFVKSWELKETAGAQTRSSKSLKAVNEISLNADLSCFIQNKI